MQKHRRSCGQGRLKAALLSIIVSVPHYFAPPHTLCLILIGDSSASILGTISLMYPPPALYVSSRLLLLLRPQPVWQTTQRSKQSCPTLLSSYRTGSFSHTAHPKRFHLATSTTPSAYEDSSPALIPMPCLVAPWTRRIGARVSSSPLKQMFSL